VQIQEGASQRIVAESGRLEGMEELGDEKGLACLICREGYAFKADEVLGIYTYRHVHKCARACDCECKFVE
jgi:E3 ubiquitin-protein ligase UBR4